MAKSRTKPKRNRTGYRPFCEKGLCQRNLWLAPVSWRKNPPSRRRRESEFVWKNGGKSVGRASRVPPFGFEKAAKFCSGVSIVPSSHLFPKSLMCHARSAWWLETKSYARRKPRHRLASLGNPKKKKSSLLFLIFAGVIFSKMERTFFFLGFCPPSIRAVWRGFNADEVLAKLFFGERICQNFG